MLAIEFDTSKIKSIVIHILIKMQLRYGKVPIQQMLVLIDKPSLALHLEGQMNYQKEKVQGLVFLTVYLPFLPFNQMGISSFEKQIATYVSVLHTSVIINLKCVLS